MCKYHNKQNLDKCMKPLIRYLNQLEIKTIACCCGHQKYPMTIVIESVWNKKAYEILSKIHLPRKKRFYRKDKNGYYYIPEVVKKK